MQLYFQVEAVNYSINGRQFGCENLTQMEGFHNKKEN